MSEPAPAAPDAEGDESVPARPFLPLWTLIAAVAVLAGTIAGIALLHRSLRAHVLVARARVDANLQNRRISGAFRRYLAARTGIEHALHKYHARPPAADQATELVPIRIRRQGWTEDDTVAVDVTENDDGTVRIEAVYTEDRWEAGEQSYGYYGYRSDELRASVTATVRVTADGLEVISIRPSRW